MLRSMWRFLQLTVALLLLECGGVTALVCPSGIDAAEKHFALNVSEYQRAFSDGTAVRQLAYNSSIVGPVIIVGANKTVSFDITNHMQNGGASVAVLNIAWFKA